MRLKLTVLLILLNAALFLTLFYMDKHADSARAFAEENSLVLKPGSLEKADSLQLDGAGAQSAWLLKKKGSDWQMIRPQQWAVNQYAVQNILEQLRFLKAEARFPVGDIEKSGMTLADYGLDNPSVTLRIATGDKEVLLRIGAPTKIGARLYVLSTDGGTVFVTSRDLLKALLVSLNDLRDERIFNIPSYMVTSISMQRADGVRVRLDKLGIGWEFESPIRADADLDSVESLLSDMAALKVTEFAQHDPAAQGLLSPALRIGIETADNRLSLLLGNSAGKGLIYAKLENSPEVFTIDAGIVDRLQQAQEVLRQRHFNRINKADLCGIKIGMGAQSATLQKLETGQWQVIRENKTDGVQSWKADPDIVRELIDSLDKLYALRFVSDAPSEADLAGCGFNDPQREIALQFPKSDNLLILGNLESKLKGVYVKTASDPFVYEVSEDIIAKLDPTPLHYRTRELVTLPDAAKITRLTLSKIGDEKPICDISPEAGVSWDQALAAGHTPEETSALTALLSFVREGRAEDFISASFDDSVATGDDRNPPWAFKLEADAQLPSATTESTMKTVTYVFTAKIGGTSQLGGSKELGLTFTLGQTMIDSLEKLADNRPKPSVETIPQTPQPATGTPSDVQPEKETESAVPDAK
jgi:hypothetical protein